MIFFAMMWWLLILLFCFCLIYCLLILQYRKWFVKLSFFEAKPTSQYTSFSIIIPARNEEENMEACLQSIFQNNYPAHHFEVVVIDDFSTDTTIEKIKHLQKEHSNLRLFLLQDLLGKTNINSYKKKAIELAIGKASGDWIITTDADCVVPQQWLSNFNDYINQNGPVFIAAPVSFIQQNTFVSRFQSLDFMSLQGITAASVAAGFHSMCNGANLAYEKEAFYKVAGFAGIDTIASGDDMLLMHKIAQQFPAQIGYLFHPASIVQTQPVDSWKSFINQRIRWASKANSYKDKRIFYVLLLVYFFNVLLFILFIASLFLPKLFLFWLIILFIKTIIEFYFLIPVARFFNQTKLLRWFPIMQPIHIVYTVVAGWLGKFGKYQWKGRKVK